MRILIFLAMLASTMYHLAEVKSRLPGLEVLRDYARPLIQLDRIFAIFLMAQVFVQWWKVGVAPPSLLFGVMGLVDGVVSERKIGWGFVSWHSCWHLCAFMTVALL